MQNLEELNICGCDIRHLPNSLRNLTALKKLDLSGNSNLKSLPEDTGSKLQNLEELDMSGCGLQQFPSSLSNLTALKKLSLSNNSDLKNLPEGIGSKLQNLEELILRDCGLEKLPLSLALLKRLDVANCQLTGLPSSLGRLEYLNCSGNPITFPPMAVWKQGLVAIHAYFSSCGSRVIQDATLVAREVSRFCSTTKQIRDLARILDVNCPSPVADEIDASQVLQILEDWLEQSGENAVVSVLTDALQESDLGNVVSSCFGDLGKDTLLQAPETSRVGKCKQPRKDHVYLLFRCHFFI